MKAMRPALFLSSLIVLLLAACSERSQVAEQVAAADSHAEAQVFTGSYELPTAEEIQRRRLNWLAAGPSRSSSDARVATAKSSARN
jgi:hypothetical protein